MNDPVVTPRPQDNPKGPLMQKHAIRSTLAALLAVTASLAFAGAVHAQSATYLHADNCAARLHGTGVVGDYQGDNDVHLYGQSHGYIWYTRGTYWHPGDDPQDVVVPEYYQYNVGGTIYTTRVDMECHGTDYLSWDRPYRF